MARTLIQGGTIVNEGFSFVGNLVIENDQIVAIQKEEIQATRGKYDEVIDATGCFVLPGVIDDHVHFREPGLTEKADIESETRAAAFGGVTSFMEMPNTNPPTTSIAALENKWQRAALSSHINYSFFFGASNDNYLVFDQLDRHTIPGIKLFMGASTGNMLVDKEEQLNNIFQKAHQLDLPVMTHCEDSKVISQNMAAYKAKYGDDPAIEFHDKIRSREACIASSQLAIALAKRYQTHLHIAHVSTAEELNLVSPADNLITFEACIAHLMFTNEDYTTKHALIKCNPSVKASTDRKALREALRNGKIYIVGTDHAPHLLSQKQCGCSKAASGMPMLQFSLISMLTLVDEGYLTIEHLVELMAHHPAQLFHITKRGFLREGYKADIAIVRRSVPWTLTNDIVQSKCGWSPLEGTIFSWKVVHTLCNGQHIYNNGVFDVGSQGEKLLFRH